MIQGRNGGRRIIGSEAPESGVHDNTAGHTIPALSPTLEQRGVQRNGARKGPDGKQEYARLFQTKKKVPNDREDEVGRTVGFEGRSGRGEK